MYFVYLYCKHYSSETDRKLQSIYQPSDETFCLWNEVVLEENRSWQRLKYRLKCARGHDLHTEQ